MHSCSAVPLISVRPVLKPPSVYFVLNPSAANNTLLTPQVKQSKIKSVFIKAVCETAFYLQILTHNVHERLVFQPVL